MEGHEQPDAATGDVPIGVQLKAARLAARKTIAEAAEQAGLTKGFVSKLERDLTKVSVASLIRLCDALDVSVGALFQPQHGGIVRRGAYPPINFGGEAITEYLLTPSGEKRVQAILSEIEPGGGSGGARSGRQRTNPVARCDDGHGGCMSLPPRAVRRSTT